MLMTEADLASRVAFVLAWGTLNTFFLVMLRRPVIAGLLSLAFVVLLVLLSQLKHSMLFMTVNFVDLMVVDQDTLGFLLTVTPGLWGNVAMACVLSAVLIGFLWWLDPRRVRRRMSVLGLAAFAFAVVVCVRSARRAAARIDPGDRERGLLFSGLLTAFAASAVQNSVDLVTMFVFLMWWPMMGLMLGMSREGADAVA